MRHQTAKRTESNLSVIEAGNLGGEGNDVAAEGEGLEKPGLEPQLETKLEREWTVAHRPSGEGLEGGSSTGSKDRLDLSLAGSQGSGGLGKVGEAAGLSRGPITKDSGRASAGPSAGKLGALGLAKWGSSDFCLPKQTPSAEALELVLMK